MYLQFPILRLPVVVLVEDVLLRGVFHDFVGVVHGEEDKFALVLLEELNI